MQYRNPTKKLVLMAVCIALTACAHRPPSDLPVVVDLNELNELSELSDLNELDELNDPAPVAIIVSNNNSAYANVADALITKLQRPYFRYSLEHASAAVIRELIDREGITDIVAVGEAAAQAIEPGAHSVIYCQVLNDRGLLGRGYRGVSALPPFELQLRHWTTLRPQLTSVGIITSPATREVAGELRAAAEGHGLSVRHEIVETDKAALFVFQRMVPAIDGFVFLPDATILSPAVIKQIMEYGSKHQVSIATYNRSVAALGATFLATTDAEDVAEQVLALLDDAALGERQPTRRMLVEPPLVAQTAPAAG